MRIYSGAVVTLCSIFLEPSGYVPVENMLCGTPVIAYNYQGPSETGWLANTPSDFVLITKSISEKGYRVNIGEQCRRHALKNFSIEACQTDF